MQVKGPMGVLLSASQSVLLFANQNSLLLSSPAQVQKVLLTFWRRGEAASVGGSPAELQGVSVSL